MYITYSFWVKYSIVHQAFRQRPGVMCRSRDVCPLILMYSLLDMYVLFCPIFPTRAYNKVDKNNKVQKVLPVFDKYVITIPVPRASYGGRFLLCQNSL